MTKWSAASLPAPFNAAPGFKQLEQAVNGTILYDVRDFGDACNGLSTKAFQTAAQGVPDGATIVIPPGQCVLTDVIAPPVGKNLTWLIYGQLQDRFPTWAEIITDTTQNGKGVFAHSGGRVAIYGMGQLTGDGPSGVSGVSQNFRNLFYFYNCDQVTVQGITSRNVIRSHVTTMGCRHIVERDCFYTGGYAMSLHRSPDDLLCDNVRVVNGFNSGCTAGNRGFLDATALPYTRGKNVRFVNCYAFAIANSDPSGLTLESAGVAFGADACDGVTTKGCQVDGNGVGTFGMSFADSTKGEVTGNIIKNYNNVHPGIALAGGLGIEAIRNVNFEYDNVFEDVMTAYSAIGTVDSTFDGTSRNALGGSQSLADATVSSFVTIGSSAGIAADNLTVSGRVYGHTNGVVFQGDSLRVDLTDLRVRSPHQRFATTANASATIQKLVITKCSVYQPNIVGSNWLCFFDDGVVQELIVEGFEGEAKPGSAANTVGLYGGKAGGSYRYRGLSLTNLATGIDGPNLAMAEVSIKDVNFANVTTKIGANVYASTVGFLVDDLRTNGARVVPAIAASAGYKSQVETDTGFVYVCTAPNTWKRVATATW